jgi:hypothetical protein
MWLTGSATLINASQCICHPPGIAKLRRHPPPLALLMGLSDEIYSEFMNSTDGAGLDSVWLDTGHVIVSTNLAIDR